MLGHKKEIARAAGIRALHARLFPELPVDCGHPADPGIVDVDAWRDWTDMETTPDQLRIEDYLDRFDLRGKRILHVGIGNSGLARRFAARAAAIVGITVVDAEARRANALGLPNYRAEVVNKHAPAALHVVEGPFDFIVDNNPTTFCCCLTHLATMLDFYAAVLTPDGQVVTDRVGLGWTTDAPGAITRWKFDFDDLAESAALVGLHAYRAGGSIYVLATQSPPRPTIAGRIAHRLRTASAKARRAVRRILRR